MTAREWVCYWAAAHISNRELRSNFTWMQTYVINSKGAVALDDIDELRAMLEDGRLLPIEVAAAAQTLENSLYAEAKAQFKDWEIPMERYTCHIEFDSYNAEITFTHMENAVTLTLDDVFFTLEGKILQCVHKF